jgi:putative peptidoglycan lipid II flippase
MTDRSGRAALVVGAGILLSRVVGLLRNTAFAWFFGAGPVADAYNAAFRIPNAMRNLMGEGTISASFVPVYSRLLAGGDERGARALAAAVLGLLLLSVSVLTLCGIVAAPLLTRVLAPGYDADTQGLITRLTQVLFPMTGLMVLSGWCLCVQNAHRRFFWSYASAALWSVAQIVLLAGWGARASSTTQLAWWLAWATVGGALLQIGAQLPEVVRLVGVLRPTLDRAAPGVREALRNMVPVTAVLGVVQLSSFIDQTIASFLATGALSSLTYANTIALLPVSLFGVSVAAAALPELARDSTAATLDGLRDRFRGGWQRIVFYIAPSAVVLVLLGDYCAGILYRGGAFGAEAQHVVHLVLAAMAVGLLSFASVKLFASVYYALGDYRTPLVAALASLVVSAALATGLAVAWRDAPHGAAAIALGSAMGSYANLVILGRGLRRRLGPLYTAAMWRGTRRIAVACAIAGGCALLGRWAAGALSPDPHPRLAGPPLLLLFGGTYLASAWWMGSREAARWLRLAPRGGDA